MADDKSEASRQDGRRGRSADATKRNPKRMVRRDSKSLGKQQKFLEPHINIKRVVLTITNIISLSSLRSDVFATIS